MRSRWFHRPRLHTAAHGVDKKVTWLELFYDLVFVAAFIQLGNGLSAHADLAGAALFGGVFVPLWVAWTGFTFFENRYEIDDFAHRIVVVAQMFAVGAMAISAPAVLDGEPMHFCIATCAAFALVSAMHLRTLSQAEEGKDYAKYWGGVFALSSLGWLVAGFLPPVGFYVLATAATVAVVGAPLSKQSRALTALHPIDFEHLGERYGLLTIIVLGESFVKVLSALVSEAGPALYLDGATALLITCSVWWIYFDDVAGSHIRKGPARWVIWLYAHLPLQMGITALGVAVKKAVMFGWDAPAETGYRWLLSGSLALVFVGVAAVDSVTERKQAELSDRTRINVRWLSAVLLLVLAPAGGGMSGGVFLSLITAVCVAQVVIDMAMAPFEEGRLESRPMSEIAREARREGKAPSRIRRDVSEAVRKGTPAELRRDLYFYFMEGSWARVFVAFGFTFVLANVFFAGLFMLEPSGIADPTTFADAFNFSVQTMSTIGYGSLAPGTTYGNTIVAVEAAVSMIGIAIITGLVFAKASRPRASVLFSKVCVVTEMDGTPTLSFRIGNARGNEVVEATMSVSALVEEITSEGHHFRRVRELRLVRRRQPLFVLSWAAFHELDADSPLANVDWNAPEESVLALVVTVTGHDSTYGQTIYARHIYYGEDIRVGHRFVDVIHELDDGRLMVDYTKFHDTVGDHDAMAALREEGDVH